MHLPIVSERTITRPVAPISGDGSGIRDANRQHPSPFVLRGEWLESASDRGYRPQPNLPIDPLRRRAIDAYRQVAGDASAVGRILDGYI